MIKILIIEDEQPAARRLEEIIHQVEPEAEILDIIDTVRDSIKWFSSLKADLIFMDIHLSDGNSFEIFGQVEVITPIVSPPPIMFMPSGHLK